MDIKAIFVDLDWTLLQGVKTVTPRTIEAFKRIKEKGIEPIVTTGRPAFESDFAMQAIGAMKYAIVTNGMIVYDNYAERHVLQEGFMDDASVVEILEYLYADDVFAQAYIGEKAYGQEGNAHLIKTCGMTPQHVEFFSETMVVVDNVADYIKEKQVHVSKILVSIADPEKKKRIREDLKKYEGIKTLESGVAYLEVIPDYADKKYGVRAVREQMGITMEQVMAIGDSENDLGMFEEAGVKVAMGNAVAELKEKADYIVPTNMEEGVAWALENLIL